MSRAPPPGIGGSGKDGNAPRSAIGTFRFDTLTHQVEPGCGWWRTAESCHWRVSRGLDSNPAAAGFGRARQGDTGTQYATQSLLFSEHCGSTTAGGIRLGRECPTTTLHPIQRAIGSRADPFLKPRRSRNLQTAALDAGGAELAAAVLAALVPSVGSASLDRLVFAGLTSLPIFCFISGDSGPPMWRATLFCNRKVDDTSHWDWQFTTKFLQCEPRSSKEVLL